MRIKNLVLMLASLSTALLFIGSTCPGGAGKDGKFKEVSSCSDSKDETACTWSKLANGQRCHYKGSDCAPIPGPAVDCSAFAAKDCQFMACKVVGTKCEDSIPAACAHVTKQTRCDTVYGTFCKYNATTTTCEDKSGGGGGNQLAYYEFTFDAGPLLNAKGHGGVAKDMMAIGRNGAGSYLYYATFADHNYVSVLDSTNVTLPPKHISLNGAAALGGDAPGARNLTAGGMTSVVEIKAGYEHYAAIRVANIQTVNGDIAGGIATINGRKLTGAWNSDNTDFHNAEDNADIFSIATMGRSWIAFSEHKNSAGQNSNFGDALGRAIAGPETTTGPLGRDMVIATAFGDHLYMGTKNNTGEALVYDYKPNILNAGNEFLPTYYDLANPKVDFTSIPNIVAQGDATFDSIGVANGGHNRDINCMAVVDGHLLVGFNISDPDTTKNAGLAIIKLSDKTVKKPAYYEWNIYSINVSEDGKYAIITTGAGILFYTDGVLTKIANATKAADLDALSVANVSTNQPFAVAGGNAGVPHSLSMGGITPGAINIRNHWYFGHQQHGIYRAKVEKKFKPLP